MACHFRLVSLPLLAVAILFSSTGTHADPRDCAVKNMKLSDLEGDWKSEVSSQDLTLPEQLRGQTVIAHFALEGDHSAILTFKGLDNYKGHYTQAQPHDRPGYLVNRLPTGDGSITEIHNQVIALDPSRYLVIVSEVQDGDDNDWGLWLRPDVQSLTADEYNEVAKGMNCAGLQYP